MSTEQCHAYHGSTSRSSLGRGSRSTVTLLDCDDGVESETLTSALAFAVLHDLSERRPQESCRADLR
jgi:hypothetical protein